jgi:hypothetical protein
MDKADHLIPEKNENNKDSQKGPVTPKKYLKNNFLFQLESLHRLLNDFIHTKFANMG